MADPNSLNTTANVNFPITYTLTTKVLTNNNVINNGDFEQVILVFSVIISTTQPRFGMKEPMQLDPILNPYIPISHHVETIPQVVEI
ncbi:MAG: hypothetical protein R2769_17410 [Saprospiraceae bacterium]